MFEYIAGSPWENHIYSMAIILFAFILHFVIKYIINRFILRITAKTAGDLDDKIIHSLKKHIKNIIIFVAIYYILRINSDYLTAEIADVLNDVFYVIFFLVIMSMVFFTISIVTNWYLSCLDKKSDSTIVTEFGPLIQKLTKGLVIIIGLTILLDHFNIDIKGLIVSLGVGSLALAFAAQETLANMIAGFVIMVDRPFRQGDRIKLESGEVGDIYEIGLRSVKIIDFENIVHIIPNKEIANKRVINYSYPDKHIRVKIDVGVAYGSDVEKVKNILVGQFKNHAEILADPEPAAFFVKMAESSLDFVVVGRTSEYTNQWRISEELRISIYNELVKSGIDIPFPQRTVHFGKESLSALAMKTKQTGSGKAQ